jgi:hypothetical protein
MMYFSIIPYQLYLNGGFEFVQKQTAKTLQPERCRRRRWTYFLLLFEDSGTSIII